MPALAGRDTGLCGSMRSTKARFSPRRKWPMGGWRFDLVLDDFGTRGFSDERCSHATST